MMFGAMLAFLDPVVMLAEFEEFTETRAGLPFACGVSTGFGAV